ncbi:MAG: ATP-binding protein [Candidatus Eisenbacteria bacterium]|nr:ATP-binding protein [Candidatus Eisenbacteria bacterium]
MNPSGGWENVELVVPSSLEYLSLVNAVAEEISERLGVAREVRDAIGSSVIEACTNAIEHGNKNDRRKKVRIRFRSKPERLEIEVSDQGTGFDPDSVADPRDPENLMRERGRGIFILRTFMDEVRFAIEPSRGTTVTMSKMLGPAHRKEG